MPVTLLAAVLFGVGLYAVLTRRELVAILAAVEVMLGGATLLLVGYAAASQAPGAGQAVTLIVLALGAAEAAVGLALVMALARHARTRADQISEIRG